jgi:lysophospholipase L1-like esterase
MKKFFTTILLSTLLLTACGSTPAENGQSTSTEQLSSAGEENDTALQQDNSASQQDNSASQQDDSTLQQESDGRNEEQEIEEETKMTRMSVSIMGDSISTFRGYIPDGYQIFFPDGGEVQNVGDTWWKRVIIDMGLTLCSNASSSGSTCAGDSTSKSDPRVGCDDMRVSDLAGENGEAPDIIIIYMGTNDLLESIPLGTNDGTAEVSEGDIQNFSDAYTLMLDKVQAQYPDAAIYCCTIAPIGTWGTDTPFVEFVNGVGDGLRAQDYNQVIEQIAANKGASVIDLYDCGITLDNFTETTGDGVHPTPLGMSYIADKVKESLSTD